MLDKDWQQKIGYCVMGLRMSENKIYFCQVDEYDSGH